MRVLITGAGGFVGAFVADAVRRVCGPDLVLVPTAKAAGRHPGLGRLDALDVTDSAAVTDAIACYKPTHVLHLAGIAEPAAAAADPQMARRVHVQGALNVGQAVLNRAPNCWLLHIGTGLVYGDSAKSGLLLDERALLAPMDEYSVTKAAADLALGALTRHGLKCIRLRPFNHTGPGQTDAFVVPAFAKQIARIEAGLGPPVIRVGNLEAERDFLDVRDVANAYALALRHAHHLEPGVILNIASGVPRRIADILQLLLARSSMEIAVERDPGRMRPSDVPWIVGNADRARQLLGWEQEYTFERTLLATLDFWRMRVSEISNGI